MTEQLTFGDSEYQSKRKQTRRETFLQEMDVVVPWAELLAVIEPVYPKAGNGRHPWSLVTMLRIHLMQNWFGFSDPGMEEALYEIIPLRRFAQLSMLKSMPDETTILNFRRLLEKNELAPKLLEVVNAGLTKHGLLLKRGSMVDATIIAAASSTRNASGERDPQMHQTKKGNQWYFGMKAHIGVDVESGLVHTVTTTAANVADVTEVAALLHGEETVVFADAGYVGAQKRVERPDLKWEIAEKRGKIKKYPEGEVRKAAEYVETLKAKVRAAVEHPFRVVKLQFGYVKARFKGLVKNAAQVTTLFALANLWMARKQLMETQGLLRLAVAN